MYDISWGPLVRTIITLENSLTQINRKTDSLFDVMGAIGGFY